MNKINKLNNSLHLVLALSLLTGCNGEDNPDAERNTQQTGLVVLNVSAPAISNTDENQEITRSAGAPQTVTVSAGNSLTMEATLEPNIAITRSNTTVLDAGVCYRIIAYKQDDVSAEGYISHGDFVAGGSGTNTALHVPAGNTYTFVCYSLNSTVALPAFNAQQTEITADPRTDDLLYARFNQVITATNKTLMFTFKHQFSLITVVADTTQPRVDVINITAALTPCYTATLHSATGALTAAEAFYARSIPWGIISAGQTVTATPCTVFTNGSNAITLNIGSVALGQASNTRTQLTATFGTQSMNPGTKYTLRLKFKGTVWANGNLAYNSGTYAIAGAPEYYSATWNGGDYWNWCVLDPTNYTGYGSSYVYETNDPCRLVTPTGSWRMPTQAEFQELAGRGSVAGMRNGKQGRYFGTTSVAAVIAHPDDYVFLPSAGYRNTGTKDLNDVGTMGRYWSASPEGSSAGQFMGFINTDASFTGGINGNTGFSIRCVAR